MKQTAYGFTLVELLVVITIMAIVGVFAFANFGNFGEEQKLKSAAQDIQSILRTAQTNATANTKCDTEYGATWQVEFKSDKTTINLSCQEPLPSPLPLPLPTPTPKKTLTIDKNNSSISSASGTSCPTDVPFVITFAPNTGKVNIKDYESCTSLQINLASSKITGSSKSIVVETGGRIYAQ